MEGMSHRYAAILAADVAHYSRLMESDGEGTVQALKDCRTIFQRCVTEHHGREFGSVGDSLMAEFQSPVEALRAARDIQTAISQSNGGHATGGCLEIRIGIHAGDVIGDGEDLYGDVVNTAARLQEKARPGGIALSGFLYEQVTNEPGVNFQPLGKHVLMNIVEPVASYEIAYRKRALNWRRIRLAILPYRIALAAALGVIVAGLIISTLDGDREPGPGITIDVPDRSIAVMPVLTAGEDTDEPVLAGMQCRIVARLAGFEDLKRVTSCRSTQDFQPDISTDEIGRELSVASVLNIAVQRQGKRGLINAELVSTSGGDNLFWAKVYDIEWTATAISTVESDIAHNSVVGLGGQVTSDEAQRLATIPTENMDALLAVERGRIEMEKRESAALIRARDHFLDAIRIDPTFADAYVGLAITLGLSADWRVNMYGGWGSPKQRQYVLDLALRFDPDNGRALSALAFLREQLKEIDEAEALYKRAIAQMPNDYEVHQLYSEFLGREWRLEEALEQSEKTHALAPGEPLATWQLARVLSWLDRGDEAVELVLDSLPQYPEFVEFYRVVYLWLWGQGQVGEALRWAEAAQAKGPKNPLVHLELCQLYFRLQDYEQTERCFEHLKKHGKFFFLHYIALLQRRGEIDGIRGVLEWNASRPTEPQGRFKIRTNHLSRVEGAYFWLQIGERERALDIMRNYGPHLFDEDGSFTGNIDLDKPIEKAIDWLIALYAAMVLREQGQIERADEIFDAILGWVESNGPFGRDRYDPGQFHGGPMNVIQVHAIRQDRDAVLNTLRDGIDAGYLGWFGQDGPLFDFIRHDPDWQRQMSRLAENTERQWQIYRERKNEPLF